jgi:putative intracellular protease/amidase
MKTLFKFGKTPGMVMVMIALFFQGHAQKKDHYNIAVFLYEGMELLDFAGPTEVFSATSGFNVYSVSVDGKPLECNVTGAILNKITPDYAMDNAPLPDVVIFPGGGTGPIAKNQSVINWVKDRAAHGTFLMSVCTGASVLANTGLLEGKNITTWYGFIPALQASHPELKVLENTRFVDNGIYLTTAGVSAGIDGALHLVSRIKGLDVAKATARYMEYDKWNPTQGRIDYENEYITELRKQVLAEKTIGVAIPQERSAPYEGELKNLAFEFSEKDQPAKAAAILEQLVKIYPDSRSSKNELAKLYRQLGRPAPILEGEDAIASMIDNGKLKEVLTQFDKDQAKFPGWVAISHGGELTRLAVRYFEKKDYSTALRIFELVAKADPGYGSFYNVGETQATLGNTKEAIMNYRKALESKPGDEDVMKILSGLEAKQ